VRRIRRAKLFVFLRQYRHILFDEPFQEELANLYRPVSYVTGQVHDRFARSVKEEICRPRKRVIDDPFPSVNKCMHLDETYRTLLYLHMIVNTSFRDRGDIWVFYVLKGKYT
jgi:hypothetical protein